MTFEAAKEAVGVRNRMGFDLFRVGWALYEGTTGCFLGRFSNKDELKAFLGRLADSETMRQTLQNAIQNQIASTGQSPRYTRPDERYDTLFPPEPKEKIVLAPSVRRDTAP